ncbi:restriction endonuclease subunit S [Serinicoccus profundi]|uniref:restriction endonuclease subunit S n=1 Tax=Serinicoccus profundi TaxID=1078471 RepID=UPI001146FD0E|nr:restriction endonuclease subunit S [Serinicoccus profundi]
MKLDEVLEREGGSIKTGPFGTVLKADEYRAQGVPVISVGEVGDGRIQVGPRTPRVGPEVLSRLPEYQLIQGDIVLGRKGAVDRSAWLRPEENGYFLGSDGIRVRFGSSVDSRFMAYQLRSKDVKAWLIQHAAGTTMASMNQRILGQLPLRVPPLGQQRAIAEVLGALDDKIAANDRLIVTALGLAETSWLKAARSAHESSTLGNVAILHYGKSLPAAERTPGDVQVFGSGGVTGTHDRSLVDSAGVVLGRKGTVGAVYWAAGPHYPIDTTYYVEPIVGLSSVYLYFALGRMGLQEMNSDSAVPGLNRERAYASPISIPGAAALQRFDDLAKQLFVLIDTTRRESATLAQTRDELLPLLMSGKVTVRDAEKQIEEVV